VQKKIQKICNYVNSKCNSKSAVGDLLSTDAHGNNVVPHEEKAKALGMHLSMVFTTEEKTTYNSSKVNHNATSSSFKDTNFCKDSILHKLSQLSVSKSPCPDSFHPRVLFEIRHEILEPLQRLFTTSYCLGQLPADWRSANIIAVYKKGNKKDPSNYRPISLTSVISKIMESIIRDFIMEHLFSNEYFSDSQYRFIQGCFTWL